MKSAVSGLIVLLNMVIFFYLAYLFSDVLNKTVVLIFMTTLLFIMAIRYYIKNKAIQKVNKELYLAHTLRVIQFISLACRQDKDSKEFNIGLIIFCTNALRNPNVINKNKYNALLNEINNLDPSSENFNREIYKISLKFKDLNEDK